MFDSIFIILICLFIKHWYVDFVNQSQAEVDNKGTYGNAYGVMHSIKHGFVTFLIFWYFLSSWPYCIILGAIDFVVHYHIDWLKMNVGKRFNYTIEKPAFWVLLGADQMLHSLTYIGLMWLAL